MLPIGPLVITIVIPNSKRLNFPVCKQGALDTFKMLQAFTRRGLVVTSTGTKLRGWKRSGPASNFKVNFVLKQNV